MQQAKRVIALGFFDGVHLGHGALLRAVAETAKKLNAIPAALTFDPHPDDVIRGEKTPLISSPAGREELMRELYGIQDVIVLPFDRTMMQMYWEDFVDDYLVGRHGAVHLVAGHDFRFGYRGEGNPERLKQKCERLGIGCDIIPPVELNGITISSSHIRTLIAKGDMEESRRFLGHPYVLTGAVGHGKKLGSALGFPTVNLTFPEGAVIPAFGVYAARVRVDGVSYAAAVNVGVRPTVEDGRGVNAEGFLLDFSGDLYDKTLRIDFWTRLREERKFSSLKELRDEVMRNVEQTRDYFRGMNL